MPSPFPGMDPYLEGSCWGSFHAQLAAEIARQLAPRLRPRYAASVVSYNLRDPSLPEGLSRQAVVEVRDTATKMPVTVINLLTPAAKTEDGLRTYFAKRQTVIRQVHLLEIDLIGHGGRPFAPRGVEPSSYLAVLTRADRWLFPRAWPIRLEEPLPAVTVPLKAPDRDVSLDVQQAFASAYDILRESLAVDYARPPEIPLAPEEQAWADELLRSHRPASGRPSCEK